MSRNEATFEVADKTNGFEDMFLDATRMADRYDRHMAKVLAPERVKKLRSFSSNEVAELLGITPSNLRRLHSEGPLPKDMGRAARRSYTAQEIPEMRRILAAASKNPQQYLPGRKEGDKLIVCAFAQFKGGSSKTSSCIHLAQRFALRGYRVLVIDLDPQASLSTLMGLQRDFELEEEGTIYDCLRFEFPIKDESGKAILDPETGKEMRIARRPLSEVAQPTYFPNLDLAPAGSILQEYEAEVPAGIMRLKVEPFYTRLRSALASVEDRYDLVFIDCPPHLGYLTLTALSAANSVLVPVVPNMIDVASLKQFLRMASAFLGEIADKGLTFRWDFLRYLLCRYEPTDGPQTQVSGFLRSTFPGRVMTNPFLKSTAIADAGMSSDTIYEVERSTINRATLNRIFESINLVAAELEVEFHKVWGRVS